MKTKSNIQNAKGSGRWIRRRVRLQRITTMTEINRTEADTAQTANNALFWIMTHSQNQDMVKQCQKMLAELQKHYGDLFADYRNCKVT